MIVGTSHFTTMGAALRHYRGYRPNAHTNPRVLQAYVNSKLATGEITIGRPRSGHVVGVSDDGRYLLRV
jgi:hypothetical protein